LGNFLDNLQRDRELKRLNSISEKIENLTKELSNISDSEILDRTLEFKNRIKAGEKVYDMLPEAFALVSEAIYRKFGFKPHRVQLMGAISIFEGRGIEMKTGEGKTITGIFPAYLNALTGEPVHIMTSNDYLASRDAETVSPVFNMLGLTVGSIDSRITPEKKTAYQADVVYGTTANFGFDFLRDNLVLRKEDKITRGLGFAIVDEADSLLLDQARTPLVLSNSEPVDPREQNLIREAAAFAKILTPEDVEIDERGNRAVLSEAGNKKAEKYFHLNYDGLFDKIYYINHAVTAKFAILKDDDYIVENNKIVLVDKTTGRKLPTHKLPEGLHQAVEAKENVPFSAESKVLGKITIQNFLRKYNRISGMSGTIKSCEEELKSIYGLDVVEIPTNKPVARKDSTLFFCHDWEKYEAIVADVLESYNKGQPVLIGTTSIEESEHIKELLDMYGVESNLLNAKNLDDEAKIVANAGRFRAVTIATDIAGRGTDIKLGGNADVLAEVVEQAGLNIPYEDIKREVKENREKVMALGGLKVIGSSLHNLVRVDGQLRGRAGRQGEVGESIFYTSLDDDLFKGKENIKEELMKEIMKYNAEKVRDPQKAEKIKENILKVIERLQEINESVDYASRKGMLTYDREPGNQYDEFYKLRNQVLETDDISVIISNGSNYLAERIVDYSISSQRDGVQNEELYKKFKAIYDKFDFSVEFEKLKESNKEEIIRKLSSKIYGSIDKNFLNSNGKTILLKTMDKAFINHLSDIESLKKRSSMELFGDSNPVRSFEEQAHLMYNEMIDNILPEVTMNLVENSPRQFNRFKVPTMPARNE